MNYIAYLIHCIGLGVWVVLGQKKEALQPLCRLVVLLWNDGVNYPSHSML